MPEQFFYSPSIDPNLTEEEIQAWAERVFKPTKTFHELPLILVLPNTSCLSEATCPLPGSVRTEIQNWLKAARQEDERLRIERRFIPHTPILIPDTAKGRQFFKLAKAIADIPINAAVIPRSQDQGYWFKTLHYFWQAHGIAIAQQLLGVIPDPISEGGVLIDRLAKRNLESLQAIRAIDIVCFRLLVHGGRHIKCWASEKNIPYPFKSPQELLLEILKERFLVLWQLGPLYPEKKPVSKAEQREDVAICVRLLKQSPWLETKGREQLTYQDAEQQYLRSLEQQGWRGYWLLALRPCSYEKQIEKYWNYYVEAYSQGKESAVDPLNWVNGRPLHRATGRVLRPVKGAIDLLGYICWHHVASD